MSLDVLPPFWDGDGLSFGPHPFGQDDVGRDYFALVMRGTQISLMIALLVGLHRDGDRRARRRGGGLLPRLGGERAHADHRRHHHDPAADHRRGARPATSRGSARIAIAVVIGLIYWTTLGRLVRGEFLSLREKEFVEAARAMGASSSRIIFRHILPNVLGTIIVSATLTVSAAILLETVAELPRPRCPAARHVARPADRRLPEQLRDPPLAVLVAGPLHRRHRPLGQLHRRRPARRLRPQADPGACLMATESASAPARGPRQRAEGPLLQVDGPHRRLPHRGRRRPRRARRVLHADRARRARHRRRVGVRQVGVVDGRHGTPAQVGADQRPGAAARARTCCACPRRSSAPSAAARSR